MVRLTEGASFVLQVRNAKVVFDPATGMSKGYGFVKFGDEDEKDRAMREMNGVYISSRQVRCSPAQKKSEMAATSVGKRINPVAVGSSEEAPGAQDPNNTTIFVGGLDHTV